MSQAWALSLVIGKFRSGCCDTSRASCWIASCAAFCAGISASCAETGQANYYIMEDHCHRSLSYNLVYI